MVGSCRSNGSWAARIPEEALRDVAVHRRSVPGRARRVNGALWPVAAILWLATLAATVRVLRGRARAGGLAALLALHWIWSGIAYHAVFFTRINPAAWGFAGLFVLGAAAFVWFGVVRHRLTFDIGWTPRHVLAGLFITYALAYPGLVLLTGLRWPRMPALRIACPHDAIHRGLTLGSSAAGASVGLHGPDLMGPDRRICRGHVGGYAGLHAFCCCLGHAGLCDQTRYAGSRARLPNKPLQPTSGGQVGVNVSVESRRSRLSGRSSARRSTYDGDRLA